MNDTLRANVMNVGEASDDKPQQIFVVGNSRSGTTLMARVLGTHPAIFTFEELHYFEEVWVPQANATAPVSDEGRVMLMSQLLSIQENGYFRKKDWRLYREQAIERLEDAGQPASPADLFAAFLRQETMMRGKQIACDQTPRNVFYIADIIQLFPTARVINMVRDPRDIVLSQKNKWRRGVRGDVNIPLRETIRAWANYHPVTIGMLWNAAIQAANKSELHPRVKNVCFEQFVRDPEARLIEICDFLGIDFAPAMLQVSHYNSSHEGRKPDKVGFDSSTAMRWRSMQKNNAVDLAICQWVCRKNMIENGYLPERIQVNLAALIVVLLLWPVKTGLAFVLNFGRMRNVMATLKKRLSI